MDGARQRKVCCVAFGIGPECINKGFFTDMLTAKSDDRLEQCQRLSLHFALELKGLIILKYFESSQRIDLYWPGPRLNLHRRLFRHESPLADKTLHVFHFNTGFESLCAELCHDRRLPNKRVNVAAHSYPSSIALLSALRPSASFPL